MNPRARRGRQSPPAFADLSEHGCRFGVIGDLVHVGTRGHGNMLVIARAHAYLALIAAARGNVSGAELALAPVAHELDAREPGFGAQIVGYAASVLAEIAGRPAEGLELLRRFWERDVATEDRYFHRYLGPAIVRLALAADQSVLAVRVAEGMEQTAALAGAVPSVHSAARRCRGLIEGDPDAMLEAVELARRGRRALDHAGTCEAAAAVFAARGRAGDARVLLAEALDRYEMIGADWYVARADASLRGVGGRRGSRGSRERPQTGWDGLTKSERAVAELVAEGLTTARSASVCSSRPTPSTATCDGRSRGSMSRPEPRWRRR